MIHPGKPTKFDIRRIFRARQNGGNFHVRTAGPGTSAPVLLALHESPRSSLSLVPLMGQISDRVRVIAPDTPGFGVSNRLNDRVTSLRDYAASLVELLDGLGLKKVALYGTHTGAAIACEFALHYPQRVSHLLLDGVPVFNPQERRAFANGYFAPYSPRWDGTHVMKLWSRMLDQAYWFPWHDRIPENEITRGDPNLELLNRTVVGHLQAGEAYSDPYALAVAYETVSAIRQLQCPVTMFARASDLLRPHLGRLPDTWTTFSLGDDRTEWGEFIAYRVISTDCDRMGDVPANSATRRFLRTDTGWLHAARATSADQSNGALFPAFLISDRSYHGDIANPWVVDPPGYGDSELRHATKLDAASLALSLEQASEQLEVTPPTIAPLSLAAARLLQQAPIPAPDLDGRHLLACWFAARNCLASRPFQRPLTTGSVESVFRLLFLAPRHREALNAIQQTATEAPELA
ncbi:alpha/beta hydrolase [Blastomonas fulva]|uniref:alpha/beta hydrolase n=1 Tax=Blastomonas fulva TaxID=1550728 RepID=UPI003F71BF01